MTKSSGGFIWYELMTPDPDAAATFYGAVVGWTIAAHSDPAAGAQDYRMIGRSDDGMAGGVLKLTGEMVMNLVGLRHDQQAAGVSIQTMHDSRSQLSRHKLPAISQRPRSP